jgi:uncharacterized membrane protein
MEKLSLKASIFGTLLKEVSNSRKEVSNMRLFGVVLMMASGAIMGLGLGLLIGVPVMGILAGGLIATGCGLFILGTRVLTGK